MSSKIDFSRRVSIETWRVQLTLTRFIEDSYWLPLIELAYENGGSVTPEIVKSKILMNRMPLESARLLLLRVVELGLLDKKFRLTEEGQEAYDKKLVPDFQKGTFTISYVNDPLIPQVVIDIDGPHEPKMDKRKIKKKRNFQTSTVEKVLSNALNHPIVVGNQPQTVMITEIQEQGISQDKKNATITLTYSESMNPRLILKRSGDKPMSLPVPDVANLGFSEVQQIVFRQIDGYDPDSGIVRVEFDELTDQERRSFKKKFEIKKPKLPKLGTFDTVVTPPLQIEPIDLYNALKWFEWCLIDRLEPYYLQPEAYDEYVSKIEKEFPGPFEVSSPLQESLASDLMMSNRRKGWLLQAPLDLLEVTRL